MGRFDGKVTVTDEGIEVDGDTIQILAERDPKKLPWGDLGVDVVVESTGFFTDRDKAAAHLDAGAPFVDRFGAGQRSRRHLRGRRQRRHLRSGEAQGRVERIVHDELLRPDDQGPRRRLRRREGPHDHGARLHGRPEPGRRPAQRPAPGPRRGRQHHPGVDRRRPGHRPGARVHARASSTARRCGCRCPTARSPTSSASSAAKPRVDEVNEAFRAAAESGPLAKVLDYSEAPLVSTDIVGSPASCTFDSGLTHVARQPGQGARLVRQRVGLLEPPRRPRRSSSAPRQPVRPPSDDASRSSRTCGDLDGKRVLRPRRLQRAASTTARSPTTSASAPRCRRSTGCRSRARTVTACSHLGRPKGAPDPKYSMDAGAGPPGRAGARRRAAGEPAVRPGRDEQRPRLRRPSSSRARTPTSTTRSAPRTGPTRRSSGRPSTCPSAAGRLLAKRGRGAARPAATTRAVPSWRSSAAPRSATSSA